jgi:Ca-activated chloride channel family protein
VLECRFAQTIGFEQGRLRVSIPTTIAPRYGNAEQAGLQPQQVPLASLDAEYPLALTLTLGEALADATAECPTHRFATTIGQDGSMRMDLAPGARLDRDVVVIVTPREPRPSLLVRANNAFDTAAPVVMMAALQPPAGTPRERIALKLIVDCSGSMNGDSIASARAALRGVVAGLSEHDHLSLSRFGSTVEHLFAPSPAKPQALRHLQPLIDGIQADLGGTEMQEALEAVFALPLSAEHRGADVLLITDGEIWQADELIAAARKSGHRVFAIGVGSAPAEGVCEPSRSQQAVPASSPRLARHSKRQRIACCIGCASPSSQTYASNGAPNRPGLAALQPASSAATR